VKNESLKTKWGLNLGARTWLPQPSKYYFLGQNLHFPEQSIQDLKVINQDMCEKAYIYSMYDQLLTFL